MKYEKAIFGIYPRSESLRINIGRHERGKLTSSDIRTILKEEKDKFFSFVKKNSVNIHTDPLFNWHDIYRPLFYLLSGLEQGELHRYKETNTFYRKPRFTGDLKLILDPFESGDDHFFTPVLSNEETGSKYLFLPSPGSFMLDSENSTEKNRNEFLKILGEIIDHLKPEKTIFYEHYDINSHLIDEIASIQDSNRSIIVTPQSNTANEKELQEYNFNGLVSGNPADLRKNIENSKISFLPFWNCKRTSVETIDQLSNKIENAKKNVVDSSKYTICNTDFFDFLPREIADRKVSFDSGDVN
ncbi:MAG: uroporphyrinogen decarboxylase/cobalamine-independent methonine synthase family protein [Thermoplasmataceae archaeon]